MPRRRSKSVSPGSAGQPASHQTPPQLEHRHSGHTFPVGLGRVPFPPGLAVYLRGTAGPGLQVQAVVIYQFHSVASGTYAIKCVFQSVLPVWGGPRDSNALLVLHDISIHAPREGSDSKNSQKSRLVLRDTNDSYNYRSPISFRSKNMLLHPQRMPQKLVRSPGVFLYTCPSHLEH